LWFQDINHRASAPGDNVLHSALNDDWQKAFIGCAFGNECQYHRLHGVVYLFRAAMAS
jgi:hypothetical protein